MSGLSLKECVPCRGGVPPLEGEEIQKLLRELDGWEVVNEHHLKKNYKFGDFREALAAGTAVVATETEGAKEVIEDQKTGLLVPIGNVQRIAESVTQLLANSAVRREIGMRAQQTAKTRFSLTRMVDEIERVYATDDTDK